MGKTRSRAWAGRGTKARRSGSEMLKTSWKESAGERPRVWRRVVIVEGLFSGRGLVLGGFRGGCEVGGRTYRGG